MTNSKFKVTAIQFFDHSNENSDGAKEAYSANVIINDEFVIQVSGNEFEAHKAEFAPSHSCYWLSMEAQEFAEDNIDIDDVIADIEADGFENNFGYISESPSPDDVIELTDYLIEHFEAMI